MAVTPYKNNKVSKTEQVTAMFDGIAPRYDFLNHLLSLGVDYYWRWRAIGQLKHLQPRQVLDVATGTGDFAVAASRLKPDKVTGIDISQGMIQLAETKTAKKFKGRPVFEFKIENSEDLGFGDNSFDAVTVGFGVRNFADIKQGMSEICRVLRPGGICVVLEPSKPAIWPFRQLFNFYFTRVLPFIGKLISKDKRAYSYLPESVEAFPSIEEFKATCIEAGFEKAEYKGLTLGICSMFVLKKQKPRLHPVSEINKVS